ncbi:hypothetical protein [Microcystis phage Mel-JY01]
MKTPEIYFIFNPKPNGHFPYHNITLFTGNINDNDIRLIRYVKLDKITANNLWRTVWYILSINRLTMECGHKFVCLKQIKKLKLTDIQMYDFMGYYVIYGEFKRETHTSVDVVNFSIRINTFDANTYQSVESIDDVFQVELFIGDQ